MPLKVINVSKRFGSTVALDGISFELNKRDEFFSLLGPSGCGKTTALRIIAGLLDPDEGKVFFEDEDLTYIPPEKRNFGYVFQNYALFPHMTVFENVAFGLKLRKLPQNEIRKRVKESLEMVGLTGLENRRPRQLSGGQQQRVAIARVLAIQPRLLLLDEPLSNLDAKLREKVRFELKDLQKRLGIPAVYVTHDQAEALVLSDRIAVMQNGKIVQIGSPSEIYRRPSTAYVADFIGISNFMKGKVVEYDSSSREVLVETDVGDLIKGYATQDLRKGEKVMLSIRPENIKVINSEKIAKEHNIIKVNVKRITFLGDSYDYRLDYSGWELRMKTLPDIILHEKQQIFVKLMDILVFRMEEGEKR